MSQPRPAAAVLPFPAAPRARRERVLDVAASVVPLLEAAVEEGNAALIERIFAALGAFPSGGALAQLEAIELEDAEVVKFVAR